MGPHPLDHGPPLEGVATRAATGETTAMSLAHPTLKVRFKFISACRCPRLSAMRRLGLVGLVCLFVPCQGSPHRHVGAGVHPDLLGQDQGAGRQVRHLRICRCHAPDALEDVRRTQLHQLRRLADEAAGVPEPRILMGNARDWHTNAKKLGYVVDNKAAVGAIAQWSKAASHVAYVEQVGSGFLVLSEDSYTSKTYRRYRVNTGDSWYPERFIHFKDQKAPVAPRPLRPRWLPRPSRSRDRRRSAPGSSRRSPCG